MEPQNQKIQKQCSYFFQKGFCKFGNDCKYLHSETTPLKPKRSRKSLSKKKSAPQAAEAGDGPLEAAVIEVFTGVDPELEAKLELMNQKFERIKFLEDCATEKPKEASQKTPKKKDWDRPMSERKPPREVYPDYLATDAVEAGLANGELQQGILRINKKNRLEAYVRFEGSDDDMFIPGLVKRNRAFDGDIVVVRKLTGTELEEEMKAVKKQKAKRAEMNMERQKKVNLAEEELEVEEFEETRLYGIVVSIVSSDVRDRNFVGLFSVNRPDLDQPSPSDPFDSKHVWFKPVDMRIPLMMVSTQLIPTEILKDRSVFANTLFTAKIFKWRNTSIYPLGSYVGKVGLIGELYSESEAILQSNGIMWEDFDQKVLDNLVPTPWSIPEEEYEKREDLRDVRIFSIDPPTARDLDDALSCRDLGDGTFEIGVHIADVSHFVKPGTNLDKEAAMRATSVYLVHKVIPMLPRLLCEELCSLNEGVERLAFSVFWIFDEEGNIISEPRFQKTIIKTCARLWYDHAQAVIDGKDFSSVAPVTIHNGWNEEDVYTDIKQLYKFSRILRDKRFDNGALTLNSIKLWFKLDELGNPIDTGMYQIKEANKLIEEYMLLANMAVATKIAQGYPDAALLRRHVAPLEKSITEKVDTLQKNGVVVDYTSTKDLNTSLNLIDDPTKQLLSRLLLIKSMRRAEYICSGTVGDAGYFHYALSVPLYTHFTSPIRRYCDLVVHRQLESLLNEQEDPYKTEEVADIAKVCNTRKFAASDAQDMSDNVFLCVFMKKLQDETNQNDGILADGYILEVGTRSYDVVIPKYGIEGRVWIEDAMDKGMAITGISPDPENLGLKIIWHNGEQLVRIFDKVQVRIKSQLEKSPPSLKLFACDPF